MSEYKWCEHCVVSDCGRNLTIDGVLMPASRVVLEFRFCPICGAPRPKEVYLREQLIQKLNQEYLRFVKAWEYEGGQYPSCGYLIPKLVDICLEFLKGKI